MNKKTTEKLVTGLMALPGLALAGKGLWALKTGEIWISPRHSAPFLLQGEPALWNGAAYALLGAALLAAVSIGFGIRQKVAISVAALLAVSSAGAFVMSFMAR